MQYRSFLLSFTATALLAAPLAINAKDPLPAIGDIAVAPAPGQGVVIDGLDFNSSVIKHDTRTATIQIKARNNGTDPISTRVIASLWHAPPVSPMARMVPLPTEVSQNTLAVSVSPGETFTRTITVKLPKNISEQLKLAAEHRVQGNSAAELEFEMAASAPRFSASVQVLSPASTNAEQIALN